MYGVEQIRHRLREAENQTHVSTRAFFVSGSMHVETNHKPEKENQMNIENYDQDELDALIKQFCAICASSRCIGELKVLKELKELEARLDQFTAKLSARLTREEAENWLKHSIKVRPEWLQQQ